MFWNILEYMKYIFEILYLLILMFCLLCPFTVSFGMSCLTCLSAFLMSFSFYLKTFTRSFSAKSLSVMQYWSIAIYSWKMWLTPAYFLPDISLRSLLQFLEILFEIFLHTFLLFFGMSASACSLYSLLSLFLLLKPSIVLSLGCLYVIHLYICLYKVIYMKHLF